MILETQMGVCLNDKIFCKVLTFFLNFNVINNQSLKLKIFTVINLTVFIFSTRLEGAWSMNKYFLYN